MLFDLQCKFIDRTIYLHCKSGAMKIMTKQKASARNKSGGLTRTRVLNAAIKMADAGGIESLSMRKLAQSLGVQAMSLYNHVSSKEDVLDGINRLAHDRRKLEGGHASAGNFPSPDAA